MSVFKIFGLITQQIEIFLNLFFLTSTEAVSVTVQTCDFQTASRGWSWQEKRRGLMADAEPHWCRCSQMVCRKIAANELTDRGAGLKPGPPARQNNNNNNTGDGSSEDESVSLPQHHGNVRMYRRVFAVGGGGEG